MVYSEEEAIRMRILRVISESFPDRAMAMGEQVTRWFARHWRNEPAAPIEERVRCRLCNIQRRFSMRGRIYGSSAGMEVGTGDLPLCSDCVKDARRLAEDDRWPSRDMVRSETLRALQANGEEVAAQFVQSIAAAFPDLARSEGACSRCGKVAPLVRGKPALGLSKGP